MWAVEQVGDQQPAGLQAWLPVVDFGGQAGEVEAELQDGRGEQGAGDRLRG